MKTEKILTGITNDFERSQSTISREIKRNRGQKSYRNKLANGLLQERHALKHKVIKMRPEVTNLIDDYD